MRAAWLLVAVALAAVASAQPFPTRLGSVATDTALLDEAAVNRAAERLSDLGVATLALLVDAPVGDSQAEAEAYLDAALQRYGFAPDESYLVVFVGLRPLPESGGVRPLIVDYGAPLTAVLERPANGSSFVDALYDEVLVPRLQAGEITEAFTAAFGRVATALESARSEGGPEPAPVGEGRGGLPTSVVLLALALAVAAWWWFRRNRRRPPDPAGAAELERVKGALSQLLIDLSGQGEGGGEDAFLPPDPERQTDFVLIRSFYGDSDPEASAALAARYREASATLTRVEEGFKALRAEEEGSPPGAEALASLAARYRELLAEGELVRAFTRELAEIWKQLQSRVAAVPDRLADLREAVAAARERLATRGPGWPPAADLYALVASAISEAEDHLGGDRALEASRLLDQAGAELTAIEAGLQRLAEARSSLTSLKVQHHAWSQAGFAMGSFEERRERLEATLQATAAGLARPGEQSVAAVAEVVRSVNELVAESETWPELQRANAERLAALRRRGDEAAALIGRGARAFDAVDDFAERNWQDIRGNGSEAQQAADRAFELFEAAAAANALGAEDGDYRRASDAIAGADRELGRAELLVGAVLERLEALQEAKATSRSRLEALEAELDRQRALLARPEVDRDVGRGPEADLDEAAALAAKARAALASAQPDWLMLVADVQAADRLVDQALASIRSEQEAMERLRSRLAAETREAEAAWSRLDNFARIHRHDLTPSGQHALQQARSAMDQAQRSAAEVTGLEDEALARALAAAADAYDAAQQVADRAYASAEDDFREMEALRADTAAAVAELEADLISFERYLRRSDLWGQMARLLGELQAAVPRYRHSADRRELQAARSESERLQRELAAATNEARRRREAVESALRRERQRRLEEERRRRAAAEARARSAWGSWPAATGRRPRRPQSAPVARPSGRPASQSRGGRKSGGWGGKGRKSGGW